MYVGQVVVVLVVLFIVWGVLFWGRLFFVGVLVGGFFVGLGFFWGRRGGCCGAAQRKKGVINKTITKPADGLLSGTCW